METKIALFVICIFFGCKVQNNQINMKHNLQSEVDTINGDSFYNLNYIDSTKYIIEWGTSNFKNVSKDTFEVLGSGSLGLDEYNSKYLVLSQPCGSSCALYVFLPLKPHRNEFIFWNTLYSNLENEIIITTVDPGLGKFTISNYGKNTEQEIILNDLCPAADKSMCIDSIFIRQGELFFQYQGSKWEVNKPDNKVKIVRLN